MNKNKVKVIGRDFSAHVFKRLITRKGKKFPLNPFH